MPITFHVFELQRFTLWLLSGAEMSHFKWSVLALWDIVKCKCHFSVFLWYHLILCHFFKLFWFFERLLIFFRSENNSGYLQLVLVCFIMVGGLEQFFRMCYHSLPPVTIHVTTHVTIVLSGVCTVSNALLLLTHYNIGYSMPYYTFLVKEVHICVIFNALPHVTIKLFWKEVH